MCLKTIPTEPLEDALPRRNSDIFSLHLQVTTSECSTFKVAVICTSTPTFDQSCKYRLANKQSLMRF